MYNYIKSIKCHHTPQIICREIKRKSYEKNENNNYTKKCKRIESGLTSVSESCTAYLLIGERTGSIEIINHNKYKNHSRKKGVDKFCGS